MLCIALYINIYFIFLVNRRDEKDPRERFFARGMRVRNTRTRERELLMSWAREDTKNNERKFLTRLGSSSCSVLFLFSSSLGTRTWSEKRQMKQLYRNLWLTQSSTHKKNERKFFRNNKKKKPWITKKKNFHH